MAKKKKKPKSKFNTRKLRRWSRLVRIRDNFECYMCQRKPGAFRIHAHHIYPKHYARYKKMVYNLSNGISLCRRCHLSIVHSEIDNWKRYTGMFKRYIRYKRVSDYNKRKRIDG